MSTTAATRTATTAVAVACLGITAHLVAPSGRAGDLTYLIGATAAMVIAWAGVLRRPAGRSVAVLIAAAVSVTVAGDVLERCVVGWAGLDDAAWLAAVAYFAGYLVLGAALLRLLAPAAGRRRLARLDPLLEAATIVTVAVLLVWTASTTAAFEASDLSVAEGALQLSTPVADLTLLAFAARAVVVRRGRSAAGWLMTAALGTWLLTSSAFVAVGGTPPDRLDAGWLVGMLLLASAALPRDRTAPAVQADGRAVRRSHTTRMLLAILPAAVPPVAHLVTHHDQHALYVPYVGMGVLLLITLIRVGRLLASEDAAHAELARSHQYFQALADNTVDAILVVDERLDVVFSSRGVEESLGPSSRRSLPAWAEAAGLRLHDGLEDALERTLAAPGNVVQAELHLVPAEAEHRWVLARFVNLLDDPVVRGIVISLSDSTARKEMELELERARDDALAGSRAKSTFLATMSHEIRTPLNGVLGLTELILTTRLDGQQDRYAEGIRVAGEALLQVINDILDFSKIEAGHLELDEVDLDVARLLDETARLVAGPAQEKGLELVVRCSPEVPLGLRGDTVRLRQILLNLASNAIKFTTTGEVLVSARLDRAMASDVATVRFEVLDTGIGVDPDQREHLFDAFTQADSTTTRRFGGTGLGLAISRQLVTAMGGEIGVEPRAGGGSRFWVVVPLPVSAVQPSPRTALADAWQGQPVLLVDDSEGCRTALAEQLTRWGIEVDQASSGEEAQVLLHRAAAAGMPYRLALLDLSMPGLNGLELASWVQATPELAGTATMLLTSGTDVLPTASLPAGLAARLVKPVRPSALSEAISRLSLAPGATPRPEPATRKPDARLLVVEDSEVNQLVAVGILEHLGYQVDVAADGLAALEALRTRSFDAVLMDCQMPVMDGYQATAEIRRLELGGPGLPVIAMTASAVAGDRERCLAAGMDDYLTKPVTGAGIEAVLARWLRPPSGAAAGPVSADA
ncbi:PAS domain-containing hybrid sensor histidine kinase/response regulator [Nocardioides sp.]|uniref:hybrid sensor histidine kinase/response regulator n=1 Tax=Nocardioides sp. TaxID=35761 RepID=UPI00260529E5|nr:PAS domain-containing hybrid sensor histidine kinase/response regulator [Nocardioides sp.]MDI6911656.1 response regulator [Nocardioides sp.]